MVNLLPGMHPIAVRALGFPAITVPALKIDGTRIQGSTTITAYLERTLPDRPPLYPGDEDERASVAAAESWGEAVLQAVPRRILRYAATGSQPVRKGMAETIGLPLPAVLGAANKPVAWAMGRHVGATKERVRADLQELPGHLDEVDRLLATGVLGGDVANAADMQILATIRALQLFADLQPHLAGRPALAAAERLTPPLPGTVPPALPREWLGAVQAPA